MSDLNNDARALLSLIFGGRPDTHLDLRAFKKGAPDHVATLSTGSADFWQGLRDFAVRNIDDRDVYFGVAGRDGKGRGAANLDLLGALFVDVDFKTATPAEAAYRIALLDAFGAAPSMIVHSGGGLHLYWSLTEPLDLRAEEQRAAAKSLLVQLAKVAAGDRAAAEPARVLRLPCSWNRKPEYADPRAVEVIGGLVPAEGDVAASFESMRYGLRDLFDRVASVEGVLREEGKLREPERERKAPPLPAEGAVPFGEQDASMTRTARALRGQGLGEKSIAAALWGLVEEGRYPSQPGREPWTLAACEDKARRVCKRFEAGKTKAEGPAKRLVLTKAIDIEPEAIRWAWEGRIPLGAPSLIAGREGHGKSSVAYDRVARITRGDLPGEFKGQPRSVVVVATEDSWAHVIVPRLTAAGADLERIYRVNVAVEDLGTVELSLPEDVPALEEVIRQNEVAMVLLDPVISRIGRRLDTHKDSEVRQALEPVVALADRTGCAVVGIIHLNKTATTDPLTAIMGSRAFAALARAVLFVSQDGETRMLSYEKNNYGPKATSETFKVEGIKLDRPGKDGRPIWTSRVVWTGTTDRSATDVLAEQGKAKKVDTPKDLASAWLVTRLTAEPEPSSKIKAEALAAGFSRATIERAAHDSVWITRKGKETLWSIEV